MAITLHDAFVVPLYCGEIGIPMFGMEMLRSLGHADGELATRVAAQAEVYRNNGPQVGARIVDVEGMLRAHGLAVPPRPNAPIAPSGIVGPVASSTAFAAASLHFR